jgi:UDP-N-acetylglucosamine--N-acetylmuramyl-(pentapeptide) pyrophosphoryl-undecaprenol N-acetylglucosamine transferase
MKAMLNNEEQNDYQYIWQCGKYYFEGLRSMVLEEKHPNIKLLAFISRMDAAYTAADLIVSRAGALSVSELCLVGKPVILVPSPNVSEDHQTKNAMSLVNREAAVLVKDSDARKELILKANDLLVDIEQSTILSNNILSLARPNATSKIVDESESIIVCE